MKPEAKSPKNIIPHILDPVPSTRHLDFGLRKGRMLSYYRLMLIQFSHFIFQFATTFLSACVFGYARSLAGFGLMLAFLSNQSMCLIRSVGLISFESLYFESVNFKFKWNFFCFIDFNIFSLCNIYYLNFVFFRNIKT